MVYYGKKINGLKNGLINVSGIFFFSLLHNRTKQQNKINRQQQTET
jgi:hypothetical protein